MKLCYFQLVENKQIIAYNLFTNIKITYKISLSFYNFQFQKYALSKHIF